MAMRSFPLRLTIAIAGLVAASAGFAHAQANREAYDLQDRCGRRAAEVFARDYGTGFSTSKEYKLIYTYRNHYNSRLNKCFYMVIERALLKDGPEVRTLELFDLNENNRYGLYIGVVSDKPPTSCEVRNKACTSESEWLNLVSPYIGE